MTATGTPGEEILDSAERGAEPSRGSRRWLGLAALIVAMLAAVLAFPALQPEPASDRRGSSATSDVAASGEVADPSLVDASATRIYGELEPDGLQSFSTAVRAATDVVRIHCRADIPSWSASLISSGDAYDAAVFLMSPANRAFGSFVVQVELSWIVDHYSYAVVAGHVERCI
ncbi:MAG: hypothetical protein M3313_03705 [Actinomycetota bacterium]|nr:hypothetical protein [Actinomycetota bacterium]